MAATALISARVTVEMKERFAAVARQQEQSESVLLKRLVEAPLMAAVVAKPEAIQHVQPIAATGKVSVRLRPDDLLLLRERASARAMPTGTYVSLLVRSPLRSLTPLPAAELVVLKRSVAEISAIGRNLNQIARAVNQGERTKLAAQIRQKCTRYFGRPTVCVFISRDLSTRTLQAGGTAIENRIIDLRDARPILDIGRGLKGADQASGSFARTMHRFQLFGYQAYRARSPTNEELALSNSAGFFLAFGSPVVGFWCLLSSNLPIALRTRLYRPNGIFSARFRT